MRRAASAPLASIQTVVVPPATLTQPCQGWYSARCGTTSQPSAITSSSSTAAWARRSSSSTSRSRTTTSFPGRCHEALVLNRPDVIEDLHRSMVEAGAEVVETDTFQASRIKLEEWGLDEHTLRDQPPGGGDRARGGRRGPLRRRLDRPDRAPARLRRPDARARSASASSSTVFAEQAAGPARGRRRTCSSSRPRRTSSRSRPRSSAPARRSRRRAARVPHPVLGLPAAQRRQDAAGHGHRLRADDARGARRST